jgi:cell division protein FtsQ
MRLSLRRTSGGAPARGRRQAKPARRGRVALVLGGLIALGGVGAGLGWALSSGWAGQQVERLAHAALLGSADAGLSVGDVLVEGRARTPGPDVLAALRVARGTPTFAFDPAAARARLLALPWVADAHVERRLPDLIYVRLEEREPLALWQLNGRLQVIDRHGEPIPGAEPARFAALPLLVGEGAPARAQALLALVRRAPELAELMVAAVRVGGRRWNVVLEGDIEVRLPEIGAAEAWADLARMVRDEALLERDVVTIDLRLPDRAILRGHNDPDPALPSAAAAGGEET